MSSIEGQFHFDAANTYIGLLSVKGLVGETHAGEIAGGRMWGEIQDEAISCTPISMQSSSPTPVIFTKFA